MSRKLEGLKPGRVFYYFEEITKIPRCSFHEEKISNFLKEFGKEQELETIQDEALNIIIKKPGTPGYENSPKVVLQGHMDMVCEQEEDLNHDFSKDPLKLILEGDFIKAEGTTLGGDNGIAVAMALALLESKDIPHPPLEVLMTTNEESGMDGAKALDPKHIDGRILINIDSEEEGTILVSCAGGERNKVKVPIEWEPLKLSGNELIYSIKTSGLQGGHSGMEIHKGRGNANKIISRVLAFVKDECKFHLVHIEGGSKTNAIPRNGRAIIVLNKEDENIFIQATEALEEQIQKELENSDPKFNLIVEKINLKVDRVFTEDSLNRTIAALTLIPTGVQSMSGDMEGLVESSNNLGIVRTFDEEVTIESAIRSSKETLKKNIGKQIKTVADIVKGQWESYGSYPAWEYSKDSQIREIFKRVYKSQYGENIKVAAIHAGLECGIFAEKFHNMDMISFGPNMFGVHTPEERLSISSTQRTYELLINVLKEIK
ncbi:Aminoacyl-histidine dipeptidase [[Clostridium] ultunense Esp]|uniref:Cytosol non-specific dipeptidase n=1 Tax=[Clostridium] ultunense Esp TaxID=1288971 RepID=M1ZL84_9FIRM|nr:aminoacyl-histidine dipeptidase [Schnuerera ultunensis]CCQ96757.1 Aminoacyl-histidine dipeptidase [[Clostridium] ultunense Esp]SHD77772.1 Aminoacyl-histidine dipeptidase [[Clostridium] ultunense Esp]